MKVSPEARRLAKYKKKEEFSVATLQFDVTFCTPIPCAPSMLSPLTAPYHTGKCIRRFAGIYAYCRVDIDVNTI